VRRGRAKGAEGADVNPAQRIAIENPCLLGEETAHPRFGYLVPSGSVVLSVNAGYE
jgi:hypothetical protein